jgi:signal transduction histidine kinase
MCLPDDQQLKFLEGYCAKIANIDDIDHLCAYVAQSAQAWSRADDAVVLLDTRLAPPDDDPRQITVPLRARQRERGVLIARRNPSRTTAAQETPNQPFDAEDERRLALLANIAAIALDRIVREGAAFQRVSWQDRTLNLGVGSEVTERVEAEELTAAYQQLSSLARRKNQFMQNTSHELRTPLTLLRGYIELLLEEGFGPLTGEQRSVLETLGAKSEQLIDLVNDISCLIEIELAPHEIENVDLVHMVSLSIETQQVHASQAGIEIRVDFPAQPVMIEANPHRLVQAFRHLLDNAIKFSPDGDHVHIRVWGEEEYAVVQMIDHGIGIPYDEQPLVFERFYQVDGSATRRFSGTGLGLAIAKETVEAHGGTVRLESTGVDGKGSTFTVILPRTGPPGGVTTH